MRIAREGRKYGVSLVVVNQGPADVSKTILGAIRMAVENLIRQTRE